MVCYVPLPDNAGIAPETIESLRHQVDDIVPIYCGPVRTKRDHDRYRDIGSGRLAAMAAGVKSGDDFFLINNSGAVHKRPGAIAAGLEFMWANPDVGAVSFALYNVGKIVPSYHVRQDCVIYRTEAVPVIIQNYRYKKNQCDCASIKEALETGGKWAIRYYETEARYLKDVGPGFRF